jgi:hypothetical protein
MVGVAGESNGCYIASIFGQTSNGLPVLIDSNNKLGTNVSSRRYKQNIKPMEKTSEAILALKPATFQYKSDKTNTPQFGLIAEEVAAVNPDLVVRDKEGKPYSVRYDQVNAMLLNEFLKEHRKVEEQGRRIHDEEATIAQLKSIAKQEATLGQERKGMETVTARLNEQEARIQRVAAKAEMTSAAPQMAASNPQLP